MKSEISSSNIDMNKRHLKKLSKSELIKLLFKQHKPKIIVVDDTKPVPTPRTYKPVPARRRPVSTPRKSVKDMVQQYEDNIILSPPEFRDDYKPVPKPRTKKQTSEKPVPEKRTIITQVEKALKGYTKSYEVELRDEKDPLVQLQKSRRAIEHLFKNLLVQTKGFKFVEALQVKFVKHSNNKKNYKKWLFQFNNRFNNK